MRLTFLYEIRCNVNNKVYIGRTCNFNARLSQHMKALSQGTHHCKPLQEDYALHGVSSLFMRLLKFVPEEEGGQEEAELINSLSAAERYNLVVPCIQKQLPPDEFSSPDRTWEYCAAKEKTYIYINDLDLIGHAQAASLVGMKRDGLNYWHRKGLGPQSRIVNGSRVYLESDVLAWREAMKDRLRQSLKRKKPDHG